MAKRICYETEVDIGGQVFTLPLAKANKGRYMEILLTVKEQLDAMLSHHSRVLVVRIDLHLNDPTPDNRLVSKFLRKFRKRALPKFGLKRFGFIWVREQAMASAQHYHFAIYLDANKVRHPYRALQLIEDIWQRWGHPKPHTPKHCYYLLSRSDKAAYVEAFSRLSYLAKVDSKGARAGATNDYSASRLKLK